MRTAVGSDERSELTDALVAELEISDGGLLLHA
jgi:hypothetical protein